MIPDEAGVFEIDSSLFCPWFVDCVENTDKYYDKKVRFTAMVSSGRGLGAGQIYVGRYAAICCAEDAQFIGFIAQTKDRDDLSDGDWIELEALVTQGEMDRGRKIILLKADEIKKVEPPEEKFLYF